MTTPGEVIIYHPTSGSKVHLLQDGSIQVEAGLSSIDVTALGSITLNPGALPVTINGDLVVTGVSTLGPIVTAGGTNIGQTHTHVGSPTAPTGAQSNTGAPV